MKIAIYCAAKKSNGQPIWLLMPDGSIYINQKFLKDATIQQEKLSG